MQNENLKFKKSKKHVPFYKLSKGLFKETVEQISKVKNEPRWMLDFRLKSFEIFKAKDMPRFGPDLSKLNFDGLYYYVRSTDTVKDSWKDVPARITRIFEKLGIPQAEQKFFGGAGSQYDSEIVYHNMRKKLAKQGVVFCDVETALKTYPQMVRKYFATIVPPEDNKFAALNSAVWSGGSFIYVPPGVQVKQPLQAYFRINAKNLGQFERTLIIADKGASVHYIEGCSAPVYLSSSLHAAVVEVIVMQEAKVRYTTIQNWSKDVYNLVTKRAAAYKDAVIDWVDFNMGSCATMKYPTVFLKGKGAKANILSMALASQNQHQDTGARVIHEAPNTNSYVVSKSISQKGGRNSFRGLVKVNKGVRNVRSKMACHALMMDDKSRSDTYPALETEEQDVILEHEASVSKISEEQLFYLMSRGLSKDQASLMIVNGFIEPLVKELPIEYAVEMERMMDAEFSSCHS